MARNYTQTIDGLPVLDATESLQLHVIPIDINAKRRRDPEHCAVAEACKRDLPNVVEARAYLSRLYIRHDGADHWLRYKLPETVRQEVAAFDRGGGFSQGTYHIPALQPSSRVGSPNRGGKGAVTGTGKPRTTYRNVVGVRAHSPLAGGALEHQYLPPKK